MAGRLALSVKRTVGTKTVKVGANIEEIDNEQRWDGQPRDSNGRFDNGSKGGKKFRISRKEKSSESPKKSDNGVEKSDKSGIIKDSKSRLTEMIKNGDVTTQINTVIQNRHYRGTKEYNDFLRNGVEKSYFTVSQSELQKLLNQKATTGDIYLSDSGAIRERINLGKVIGYDTRLKCETSWVTVFYSKSKTHLSPYVPMLEE